MEWKKKENTIHTVVRLLLLSAISSAIESIQTENRLAKIRKCMDSMYVHKLPNKSIKSIRMMNINAIIGLLAAIWLIYRC